MVDPTSVGTSASRPNEQAAAVGEPKLCGRRCLRERLYDHVRCYDLTGADLRELPSLYGSTWAKLTPAGGHGDRITGSRERPLGINTEAHDLLTDIRDVLTSWCGYVAEKQQLSGPVIPGQRRGDKPDRDLAATVVVTRARWLTRHHDWLSRCPDGWSVAYGEEIRDLAHRARLLCDLYPARPLLKPGIPCRNCDNIGLIEEPGEDRIVCRTCGLRLTNAEYTDWVKWYAAYMKGQTA